MKKELIYKALDAVENLNEDLWLKYSEEEYEWSIDTNGEIINILFNGTVIATNRDYDFDKDIILQCKELFNNYADQLTELKFKLK